MAMEQEAEQLAQPVDQLKLVQPDLVELPTETIDEAEFQKPKRFRRLKRALGIVAMASASTVAGGVIGATVAPTHTELGPHRAEVQLHTTGPLDIDLGPIGDGALPYNWHGFGVDIAIKGIPINESAHNSASDTFTDQEVQAYASMFTNPEHDQAQIKQDLLRHSALAAGLFDLGAFTLYAGIGKRRRQELLDRLKPYITPRAVLSAALVGYLAGGILMQSHSHFESANISHVFDETPFEGTTLHGKYLKEGVNKWMPKLIDYVKANKAFEEKVEANLETEAKRAGPLLNAKNTTNIMYIAGVHSNFPIMDILGTAARLKTYSTDLLIDGGDDSSGILDVIDSEGIKRLAAEFHGIDKVVALGNHDPAATKDLYRKYGFTVLDGKVVRLHDLTIIGDSNPWQSEFGDEFFGGDGRRIIRHETTKEMGNRLGNVACQAEHGADIAVTNQPAAAEQLALSGCTKLALTAQRTGSSLRYQESSTGVKTPQFTVGSASGEIQGKSTFGPVQADAQFSEIVADNKTGYPLAMRVTTVHPDASVDISQPIWFETAPPNLPPKVFSAPRLR